MGWVLMLLEVTVGKKNNILFKFSNVNKLAINKLEVPHSVHCAEVSMGAGNIGAGKARDGA